MATTVKQLLERKGSEIVSVDYHDTVLTALGIMAEREIGAVLVLKADQPVGIFSERDYARKVILLNKSSNQTAVHEIMSNDLIYATPHQTINECMQMSSEYRIRHLPVKGESGLMGMLSIGDLVKALLDEQTDTIEQLENYIASG